MKITQWTDHFSYTQDDPKSGPQKPCNSRHSSVCWSVCLYPSTSRTRGEDGSGNLPTACLMSTVNSSRRPCFKCMLFHPWLSSSLQAPPAWLSSKQIKQACLHEAAFSFPFISFLGATNQIPDCAQPTLKQNVTEPSWLLAFHFCCF